MASLRGKSVAILATDGFEQSELMEPLKALRGAEASVDIVSLEPGEIRGWKDKDWGDRVPVDRTVEQASPDDYDALVLPGGQINPDVLRADPDAVGFVRAMVRSGKPVAAICHGPWLLVEAGALRGLRATSYKSIRTDMTTAGADWVDEAVVVDDGIVTSRQPGDLPAFCARLIEEIGEGRHHARDTV